MLNTFHRIQKVYPQLWQNMVSEESEMREATAVSADMEISPIPPGKLTANELTAGA